MKNYYKNKARKLLKLDEKQATMHLNLIRRFNGDEEADKIIAEICSVMMEV